MISHVSFQWFIFCITPGWNWSQLIGSDHICVGVKIKSMPVMFRVLICGWKGRGLVSHIMLKMELCVCFHKWRKNKQSGTDQMFFYDFFALFCLLFFINWFTLDVAQFNFPLFCVCVCVCLCFRSNFNFDQQVTLRPYNTALLPSVNTTALGMFCGAKYATLITHSGQSRNIKLQNSKHLGKQLLPCASFYMKVERNGNISENTMSMRWQTNLVLYTDIIYVILNGLVLLIKSEM